MSDPVSGFEFFEPISGAIPSYPSPLSNVKLSAGSYPTNSWFQNAITDSVDSNNRFANVTPWYWKVNYDSNKFSLSHTNRTLFVNTTTNGNLQQIEAQPSDDIVLSVVGSENQPMYLNNFDDYTATFSNSSSSFIGYPCRGSPFATFQSTGLDLDLNLDFLAFGITSVTGTSTDYIITTQRSMTTITNTGFDNVDSLSQNMTTLSFYDGVNSLNTPVTATLSYQPGVNYNAVNNTGVPPLATQLIVNTLGVRAEYIWNHGINATGGTGFIFTPSTGVTGQVLSNTAVQITYTRPNGIYSITVDTAWNLIPHPIAASFSKPTTQQWLLYGPSSVSLSGSRISIPNYTGIIQLAAIDSDQLSIYRNYLGNYITSGLATSYQVNGAFSINYTRIGSSQLLLLPSHWSSFGLSGLTPISGSIPNIIYGTLSYYSLNNNTAVLIPKSFTIPPLVSDISTWTSSQRNSLEMQVINDAAFLAPVMRNFVPASDPYSFGQFAAAIGRLFLFASQLNILNNSAIVASIGVIKQYLEFWLSNTNNTNLDPNNPACGGTACMGCSGTGPCVGGCPDPRTIFHLQREQTWGGIIVPADYLNAINPRCYGLGSFGNSFYNDHHFHWGYILYALNCLEYIGQGLSTQYPKQITALIKDLVNPISDSFSWKTRHKDWYAGHSWATGNTTEVSRQQESASEAINGYYGAYLMAQRLGAIDLQSCAAVCLNLEIQACQDYYYLQGPGTQLGLMNQVHGVGIIFNNSKQFTLDWGMQPDSFPGRAIGIYGIQSIPFTDIAKIQIPTAWASSLPNSTPQVGLAYSITPTLVEGLCDNTYQGIPVYDTNWNVELDKNFDVMRDGSFWGLVGLKMLIFGTGIDNLSAQAAYNSSISKQQQFMNPTGNYFPITKQFDTFSNTLYWLISTGKWNSSGTSSITIGFSSNDDVIIDPIISNLAANEIQTIQATEIKNRQCGCSKGSCKPLPIPSKRELLEISSLRNQGLVQVPIIRIKVCFNEAENDPRFSHFQIRDDRFYCNHDRLERDCRECCINEKGCKTQGICPEKVKITQLSSALNITDVISAPGANIYEKVQNIGNGVSVENMLVYGYLKLILARILYGEFNLKYLTQRYNDRFFRDLARSRFCNFINGFTNILNYNQYFY